MKIDVKDLKMNSYLWVCDYRLTDAANKPIRALKPTKVFVDKNMNLIKINKNDYLSNTIVKIYDNVVWPCAVQIFDNEQECIDKYNHMVKIAIVQMEEYLQKYIQNYKERLQKTKDLLK